MQRVPASGPALSHPRLGGAVAHAWRPGRTRPKDGHWAKRPSRAGYARPAHDFCTRGQHLDACAGVKIWALPRTCIRRSRAVILRPLAPRQLDVVWPRLRFRRLGRGDGSPRAPKRQAGQLRHVLIQNTRTLNQHATSLRVILLRHRSTRCPRANTLPTGPVSLKQKAWQPRLEAVAAASRARAIAVQDDRLLSRWRSHRLARLQFLCCNAAPLSKS